MMIKTPRAKGEKRTMRSLGIVVSIRQRVTGCQDREWEVLETQSRLDDGDVLTFP